METVFSQAWTSSTATHDRPSSARRAVQTLFFMNGALFATWASRIPAVQAGRGLSNGMLGLALLSVALGAITAMPLAGRWIARSGSDRVCRATALWYAVLLPVMILVPGLGLFLPALFLFGATHGALDVAMNSQAVAVERRYRKPIMSSFHALWSTGGLFGAAVGGLLAARGWSPLAHASLAAVVLGLIAYLALPHLLDARGTEIHLEKHEDAKPFFTMPDRAILALGVVAMCVMIGEGAMADWSAVYLRNILGTREGVAAAGYAAFSVAMAGGRFFGDSLAARFGPVTLVRFGGAISALGLLLALLFSHTAVALVGFACVGVGFATIVPMVFSAAGSTPGVSSGVALASVTTTGYFGFLVGPPLIGFVAQLFGLRCALGIIVATSLMIVVLASAVRNRHGLAASKKPEPSAIKIGAAKAIEC